MADGSDELVPVEQDVVTFYDRPIVAVRLADGRIAVVLRWLCEGLQLDTHAQLRRIRRTEAIEDEVLSVRVDTDGGVQVMPALTLRALPFWLAGITPSKTTPELRPVILAYQREVVDVLYRHFAERRPRLAEPLGLVPAQPVTRPDAPGADATSADWLSYHQQMVAWLEWQRDVDRWRASVESRLESHEQVLRLVPEILERLGPATLGPEHQRTVQAAVNRLHELTHRPHAAIYDELRQAFRVGSYKDIPEARWADIAAWFRGRIARAGGGHGQAPEQGTLL